MTSILEKIKAFVAKHELRADLSWLNYIAISLCGWHIAFHMPNGILFLIILCIPILGIILTRQAGKKSLDDYISLFDYLFFDFYYIQLYILIPSIALAFRVYLDFEFENFYSLITHVSIAFAVLFTVFILTHKKIMGTLEHKCTMYALLAVTFLLYSYGAVYGINCLYDVSEPVRYETRIIAKFVEINRRKNPKPGSYYIIGKPEYSYKITIAPWGQHHDHETLDVNAYEYNMFESGDYVYVNLQSGLFGIPWYHLDDTKPVHTTW